MHYYPLRVTKSDQFMRVLPTYKMLEEHGHGLHRKYSMLTVFSRLAAKPRQMSFCEVKFKEKGSYSRDPNRIDPISLVNSSESVLVSG